MADTPTRLSERLITEGEKTAKFFDQFTPEQWSLTVYTEGSAWSVHKVLAHFVNAEYNFGRLIANIAEGGQGAPEDFQIDAYNERKVKEMENISADTLLEQFTEFRTKTAEFVSQMPETALSQTGRHPFLGVVPLVDIIKLVYIHNQIHLRDIRRVIAGM